MRTAVLRIDIDPGRELTAGQRSDGLAALQAELAEQGPGLLGVRLSMPERAVAGQVGAQRRGAGSRGDSQGAPLPSSGRSGGGSQGPEGTEGTADASSAEKDAPPRELQFLLETADAEASLSTLVTLCARAFDTAPRPGVVTYVSRGTDDDARGVLAGFGLRGEVTRTLDDDGFDIVHVRLREDDLRRVPESRVHTALEASLNCEVRLDIH